MATNSEGPTTKLPRWIIQIDEELKNEEPKSQPKTTLEHTQKNERKACIYRLNLVDDLDLFTPLKVKFSPYYHTPQCIEDVEDTVKPALVVLRRRGRKLEDYYMAVEGVFEELKMSYDQLDPVWEHDKDAFLKLMVLNGCYLLELLRYMSDETCSEYGHDNPLLRVREEPGEKEVYRHDMLLLENQLPMQLLLVLLKAEGCSDGPFILGEYISKVFFIREELIYNVIDTSQGEHILDVVRKAVVGFPKVFHNFNTSRPIYTCYVKRLRRQTRSTGSHFSIPTATELDKVGIRVTTSDTTFLADITFERRTLKIPQISIDRATKSRFFNMIVFENLYKKVGNEVTSYLYFMRFLVTDMDDFKLLQSRGVINTALTLDEATHIFHSMIKDVQLDSYHLFKPYFRVGRMVKKRHDEMSVEWRKDLRQNYLKSPWAIISVVAAILLFTLTAIQTVFTVLSYVHPK